MAEPKKRTSSTPKPQKRETAKRVETKKSDASKQKNEQNQFWSVILFAAGVLTGLMVLISGSDGWNAIHKFLLGMFGVSAFFVPLIFIYTAFQIGMDKSQECVAGRAVWGIALMFLTSAAIQIFFVGEIEFKSLYSDGVSLKGGGVASVVIAGLLIKVFGCTGARIITVVMFFVFVILLSGLGIIDFFKLMTKPFKFMGNLVEGFQNLLMGGTFEDAFDDDVDDDKEKKSFDKDLEAIEIVNSRKRPDRHETAAVHINNDVQSGDKSDSGFPLDIPLPTDKLIERERKKDAKKASAREELIDEGLEFLISRAAGSNSKPEPNTSEEIAPETEIAFAEEKTPEIIPEKEPEKQYILPSLELLALPHIFSNSAEAAAEMREKADIIVNTLRSFGVEVKIKDIFRGPSITRYEIQPGIGVKISKIKGLEDDIALSLAAQGVRIEAPVPGKAAVGIEIPNSTKDTVTLREILSAQSFRDSESKLTFAVGKDITGNIILGDIAKMPHVIIAGTTGSGKSVCTRSIIMSILYNAKPNEVKLILIDPKMVEFKVFEGIPHLLIPIVIEAKKAAGALNWAVNEMMRRYSAFADLGANDLKSYNALADENAEMDAMPQIVVFIDELADMMLVAGKEVEDSICRLAQMGRAAGMHLVVATQRPTTDVITGLIKANIPSRIALSVKSQIDSRTIIDMAGADKLLGNGDMLYMPIGMSKPIRVQGCFASNKDIVSTLDFIKAQAQGEYDTEIIEAVESFVPTSKGDRDDTSEGAAPGSDEDFIERAMEVAVNSGQLSTTMLQRKLKLGYAKAARIMDELEEMGVIGPSEGAKPRRVLMSKMQFDERKMRRMQN
ncbi:MAG TPA: DNA translocase FtsK 4TM domain-containing protein [Ruminococcus sp.]